MGPAGGPHNKYSNAHKVRNGAMFIPVYGRLFAWPVGLAMLYVYQFANWTENLHKVVSLELASFSQTHCMMVVA